MTTPVTLPLTPLQAHRIPFLVVGATVTTVSVFAIAWFATHLFTFSLIGSAVMGVTAGGGATLFFLSLFHRLPPPTPERPEIFPPRPPSRAMSEESFQSCHSDLSEIDQNEPRALLNGWIALTTNPQPLSNLTASICYPPLSQVTGETNFAPPLETILRHYFWVSNQQTRALLDLYRKSHPVDPHLADQREGQLLELRREMEANLLTSLQNPETGLPLLISFALNGVLSFSTTEEARAHRSGHRSLDIYSHRVIEAMCALDPDLQGPAERWIRAVQNQANRDWDRRFPFASTAAQQTFVEAHAALEPADQLQLHWAYPLLLLCELDVCFKKSWGCLVDQLTGTDLSVRSQRYVAITTGLAPRRAVASVVDHQIAGTPFASSALSPSRDRLITFAHDLSAILFNDPFIGAFKRANLATIDEPHPGRFVQEMIARIQTL